MRAREVLRTVLADVPGSEFGGDKAALGNRMTANDAMLKLVNGTHSEGNEPYLPAQPLYQNEMQVEGHRWYIQQDYDHRDATFGDILHLVEPLGKRPFGDTRNNAVPAQYPDLDWRPMKTLVKTLGAVATLSCLPAFGQEENPAGGANPPGAEAVDGGDVEKKMIGYWAPDPAAMLKEVEKELGEGAAQALPLIQAMLETMAVEISRGEVTVHVMGQKETATYVITKADNAANRLTMQVTDLDGRTEGVATVNVKDTVKTLTLERDGEKMVLNSITASEFEKRKKAAAQPPALPGIE